MATAVILVILCVASVAGITVACVWSESRERERARKIVEFAKRRGRK